MAVSAGERRQPGPVGERRSFPKLERCFGLVAAKQLYCSVKSAALLVCCPAVAWEANWQNLVIMW